MHGYARLCMAVQGCVRLCLNGLGTWVESSLDDLALAITIKVLPFVQSLNYPYFVFGYCGGFYGNFTRNIIQA
jgi:hypothetical protein